jgi:hypothetical protein
MSHDINDNKYMPVSRELSKEAMRMIRNWLKRPIYKKTENSIFPDIKTYDDLRKNL